jgi:hypothetical protein
MFSETIKTIELILSQFNEGLISERECVETIYVHSGACCQTPAPMKIKCINPDRNNILQYGKVYETEDQVGLLDDANNIIQIVGVPGYWGEWRFELANEKG